MTRCTKTSLYRNAILEPSGKVLGKLDSSGKVLALHDLAAEKIHFDGFVHRYLREAVAGKKATISDLHYAPEVGNRPAIAYVAPIVKSKNQEVVALVVIWVNAEYLWNILHEFHRPIDDMDPRNEVFLSLCDKTGIRIADSKEKLRFHPTGETDKAVLASMIKDQRFGPETDRLRQLQAFPEAHLNAIVGEPDKEVLKGVSEFNEESSYGRSRPQA